MIHEVLSKAVQSAPRQHWLSTLEAMDVPCAPINNFAEVFEDPQVKYLDRLVRVDDPEFGTFQLVRNGVNLSETPAEIRLRPPKLGEHNAEILRTLGYDATQIEALRARKII